MEPAARAIETRPRASRLDIVAMLGFLAPAVFYLWFLHHYGVNVVYQDQWADVAVVQHSYNGTLSLSVLWAQHNENRIFFPNLVMLVLAHASHFNVLIEEYVSALMLFGATALVIWTHKRHSPSTRWIYYCPVAIVMLSIVQFENTLWGFQLAFYLVLFTLALTLFLLERDLTWPVLGAATAAAVVCSFSSLQGLLVWPVGLLFLARRGAPRVMVGWTIAGIASAALYNYHLRIAAAPLSAVLTHPWGFLQFFLVLLGDAIGEPVTNGGAHTVSLLLGVVVLGLACVAIVRWWRSGSQNTLGVALIAFGVLFAVMVTIGRAFTGFSQAGQSRYRTFTLLVLVGTYLVLVVDRRASRRVAPVSWAVLAVMICLQLVVGLPQGISGGRVTHIEELYAEDVVVNIARAPNSLVDTDLYLIDDPSMVRTLAVFEKRRRLSTFNNTSAVVLYHRRGLDVGSWFNFCGPDC